MLTDTGKDDSADVLEFLRAHAEADRLRLVTCGSVDDGKSTLIGRLLYESRALFADQLTTLAADSSRFGTRGGELDFALLVDGLEAEREQGITIDVAYRFLTTPRRHFVVADSPGHVQYTRNMVTAASTSDVAVILVDARKGVLTQTRRHTRLVSLVGIRRVVLAVNKLDLAGYAQDVFDGISAEYAELAADLGIEDVSAVPVSALHGDNIVRPSEHLPWYPGKPLLRLLEDMPVQRVGEGPLRLPVQRVERPDPDFRGYSGSICGGRIEVGDEVAVLPSGSRSRVTRILSAGREATAAGTGEAVTLVLADDIDVSRGDLLCAADDRAHSGRRFTARIVWMAEEPMLPGRQYLLKIGTLRAGARVTTLHHRVDVDTGERLPAAELALNEIALAEVELETAAGFDRYARCHGTGGFILIDRLTGLTVGAGMVEEPSAQSAEVHWQDLDIDKTARTLLHPHRPCVIWFTGLSGAGKSTIANLVERKLYAHGVHTYLVDGDNLRHGLNADLGFSAADRVENVRRAAEVAALMVDAGLVVLVSLISPFLAERARARSLVAPDEFCEVHVDVPLAVAEQRDPKGLYRKARTGGLADFTGISSPYEPPPDPDIRVDTTAVSPEQAAEEILRALRDRGTLQPRTRP
ncbi:sulfate adenylyltransferase subunit CysN [Amycolatopsis cynarae]|uniref:Multifunctional fusion protein n=1 Tax=Amycolatopsis cynarae TaxID=2995223 RepID=A0ABY7AV95_9PSEU|nr:sulfate adenylyltransferase subunit CysN [Amycolatopsis sp. HUAS 11-8]WAL62968.1 sulfate adenylyltransferase subunit CysN [Amycolatopsis sp. HUAS 11-8]